MAALGLPVPPAFVLPIKLCAAIVKGDHDAKQKLRDGLADGIAFLETATGKRFGDRRRPLLVSVRSGAARSMPGMLDTVLDVGCTGSRGARSGAHDRPSAFRLGLPAALPAKLRDGRAWPRSDSFCQPAHHNRRSRMPRASNRSTARASSVWRRLTCRRSKRTMTAQCRTIPWSSSRARRWRSIARGRANGRAPIAGCSSSKTCKAPPSRCRRWCSAIAG